MENKKCICCHKIKPNDNFSPKGWKSPYELDRDNICDKCKRYHGKSSVNDNDFHKKKEKSYYKRNYNITNEEYNFLFAAQEGKCKICETHQSDLKKKLSVDHCHETGHVRGLLCQACNSGIGFLKDSAEILEKAINYIRKASFE